MPNRLSQSASPYLRQHAENPVDWYEWGSEALSRAKQENKPLLVSIGYSACHWCHVMAHESFEDVETAAIMNEHFINIKIDREERPDIDQIYMDAIQAMGLNGGWPLNVFITPEQKPFYGGTYFPRAGWKKLLMSIHEAFVHNRAALDESAEKFARALNHKASEKYLLKSGNLPQMTHLQQGFDNISKRFDREWGGMRKAPKFPMPSIWSYLYHLHCLTGRQEVLDHLDFTLNKMADGGIYDQIGGGFARYSVDAEWHVPHFEKMLYDNAQLMTLFAQGFRATAHPYYQTILRETFEWLQRDMESPEGGYYAALDADSEGVEGKYYVWGKTEFDQIAGIEAQWMADYFDVSDHGNWEHTNVLRKLISDQEIARKYGISDNELHEKVSAFKKRAVEIRAKRIAPGLDDKVISGWNGLLLTGLLNMYHVMPEDDIKQACHDLLEAIKNRFIDKDVVKHVNTLSIEGFSDDYAALIQSLILYAETFGGDENIKLAEALTNRLLRNFWDEVEEMFYYTSSEAESLIARKSELFDNVIPSSNSLMAENLIRLSMLTGDRGMRQTAETMLSKVAPLIEREPEYLSQWGIAASFLATTSPEIIIVGPEAEALALRFHQMALPCKVVFPVAQVSSFKNLQDKIAIDGKTTIYICYNQSCQRPVFSAVEALDLLPEKPKKS